MPIETINPATGETVATFQALTDGQLEKKLQLAADAAVEWRARPLADRTMLLQQAGGVLESRAEEFAALITLEMGKPLAQARAEVGKCAWACRYYAEAAEGFLRPQQIPTEAAESYVRFDPLGPVLAVMPWNFPFWQVFRFAAPALAAGNVGLLKHASNVPQCAQAIEEIFRQADAPAGVFTTLLVGADKVPEIIADRRVAAITLTGSEPAGRQTAEAAGKHLKKTVLELGGSDPFIILPDADLEQAVATAVTARTQNSGQSCIAAKRFIVHQDVAEAFTAQFTKAMKDLKVGDPTDESIQVGPLAREDLVDELDRQVHESVAAGATLETGGQRARDIGAYYQPTVLSGVAPGMPAYHEELFGPAASVIVAESTDDAIRIANDTDFGLGAAVWTADVEQARELAAKIESGFVAINGLVKSDPRLPFGGIKNSGYGRELGEFGLREFVNVKTVVVG